MSIKFVLGTRNLKKRNELERLLQGLPFTIQTLGEFSGIQEVIEDGETFGANAVKKAEGYALQTGNWTICDDSGVSVDALGGRPGIFSARYAGTDGDDSANNTKLLSELSEVPFEKRGAYYTCHLAVSDPNGKIHFQCEEICRGKILTEADGKGGFGYDPLFQIEELHQTFGRLGAQTKSLLSHRGRAMRKLIMFLRNHQQLFSKTSKPSST